MTAPINPVPLANTAPLMGQLELSTYANFYHAPIQLQGLDTAMVHIAPNGAVTHLSGPGAGGEGVTLYQKLQGEQHLPFEQVVSESAFQWGSIIERTNYPSRKINLRVLIGGAAFDTYQYQLCDNRWWEGQDETQDGWLGVYTRFTGWRWIPVRPEKTIDTAQTQDPVAFQNNMAVWDINWICQRPWYSKPTLYSTWTAQNATRGKNGWYGTVTLANQGDMQTYVQYLIKGSGTAWVQDNNSTQIEVLPLIFDSDGPCMCDTDPQNRTLTASNDPIDNIFYQYLRSSNILNFLLGGLAEQGEPWWQRGYVRFVHHVPPQSTVKLTVAHSNPKGTITAMVPQRYKRSR